jgi:hypothetical protein
MGIFLKACFLKVLRVCDEGYVERESIKDGVFEWARVASQRVT